MVKRIKRRGGRVPIRRSRLSVDKEKLDREDFFSFIKDKTALSLAIGGLLFLCGILYFSFRLIQNDTLVSFALLYISLLVLGMSCVIIVLIMKIHKNYNNPLWIISLGLITTFVGFTLSGSFEEMKKEGEEKTKLKHLIMILEREKKSQLSGVKKTDHDFHMQLFYYPETKNETFYVRKQLSVYNNSNINDRVFSNYDLMSINNGESSELINYIANIGDVSELYDSLTFESKEPKEMLQSYLELISLQYKLENQISSLHAEHSYLEGDNWNSVKKKMNKDQKENEREITLKVNKLQILINNRYGLESIIWTQKS